MTVHQNFQLLNGSTGWPLPEQIAHSMARAFEVWRWPDGSIVVLTLDDPETSGRSAWHDVLVLYIDNDLNGWVSGDRGIRWTVSSGFGWERVL